MTAAKVTRGFIWYFREISHGTRTGFYREICLVMSAVVKTIFFEKNRLRKKTKTIKENLPS